MVASAGCIDIFNAERYLIPRPDTSIKYHTVEKAAVFHSYESPNIFLAQPIEEFNTNIEINIVEQTEWLNLRVKIEMVRGDNLPPEVQEALERLQELVPEIGNASEYLDQLQRHVWITLYKPDNFVWQELEYNSSAGDIVRIPTPEVGLWTMKIESRGFGVEDRYQDSLEVVVNADEPRD